MAWAGSQQNPILTLNLVLICSVTWGNHCPLSKSLRSKDLPALTAYGSSPRLCEQARCNSVPHYLLEDYQQKNPRHQLTSSPPSRLQELSLLGQMLCVCVCRSFRLILIFNQT